MVILRDRQATLEERIREKERVSYNQNGMGAEDLPELNFGIHGAT